jgi:hypothetical protein
MKLKYNQGFELGSDPSKIADEFETKAAFGAPTHRSLLCEARPECRAPSL